MHRPTAAERFLAKVQRRPDGCWIWVGKLHTTGYGGFKVRSYTQVMAHRWSYEYHVAPIPAGYTIDHLCRVRACVNPDHLEAVTQAENNRRRPRPPACPSGHEFTPENTAQRPAGRVCRSCERARARAAYWRKRAAA